MKNTSIIIILVTIVFAGGIWWSKSLQESSDDSTIISSRGVHWHPQLAIYLNGEKQNIPANIGLIGGHNPMHTHDPDGVVHLEYDGVVREDDTKLGRFFGLWGKQFNEECIFDYCNDEEGGHHMMMFVNGKENFEFGNYMMRDGDKIEIRYE